MSHTATRQPHLGSLRTPLPPKRSSTAPHSAASTSSASSVSSNTALLALSASPAVTAPARLSAGRATPPTVKLNNVIPSHHRRVSSFSPSALSPQAADDKQAGRTPRRRAVEASHAILPAHSAALPAKEGQTQSGGVDAGARRGLTPQSARARAPSSAEAGSAEQLADAVSDGDILGKLHQLLEEALVIQQAQGQVQAQREEQPQQQEVQRAQRLPLRPLSNVTNTPRTQLAHQPASSSSKRTASAARSESRPASRTQPKKSALKKPMPTAASTAKPRLAQPARRALISSKPNNPAVATAAQPPPPPPPSNKSLPASSSAVRARCSKETELSVVIRGFLQRVLSLLRAIERLLSRRMAELRAEAVALLKDSWCSTSGISLCLERLASTSSSLLHTMHAAIHTPIITLHYPEALTAFLPSFLSSSRVPAKSSPASSSSALQPPLAQATPAETAPMPALAPKPASLSSTPSTIAPSSPSAATAAPLSTDLIDCPPAPRSPTSAASRPSWDSERAVLVSTLAHLQTLLSAHQAAGLPAYSAPLSSLAAENRDLRSLIEAQEQQIARQQEMIAQARRQIEWQCEADGSSSGDHSSCSSADVSSSASGAGIEAILSLELSALSEAADGSNEAGSGSGSGSRSACGNVSALMRAEWESGVQEVLSW
ncbi:hypothetical protein MMC34_008784 [Xylographa carneopallida]|nr:hypothetical protein [Xylographa carneopallida]